MKPLELTSTVVMLLVSSRGLTEGFLIEPQLNSIPKLKRTVRQMVLDSSSTFTLISVIQSTFVSSPLSNIDPFIEAEIFSDAAHVALDFTALLGPATIAIRLFAVLGRLFCIASDYIPDHTIRPDEFFFQFTMLAFALTALAQSLTPVINAYNQDLKMRDRKCFASLFSPGGLSWMQYKILAASALEWKELPPGSVITSNELFQADGSQDLYWLYSGEVLVQSQGRVLQKIVPKTHHLFGDLCFAFDTPSNGKKKFTSDRNSSMCRKTIERAGSNGAKVLRIDTSKLKQLMERDKSLDKAIRNILMESMHEHVAALLANAK